MFGKRNLGQKCKKTVRFGLVWSGSVCYPWANPIIFLIWWIIKLWPFIRSSKYSQSLYTNGSSCTSNDNIWRFAASCPKWKSSVIIEESSSVNWRIIFRIEPELCSTFSRSWNYYIISAYRGRGPIRSTFWPQILEVFLIGAPIDFPQKSLIYSGNF